MPDLIKNIIKSFTEKGSALRPIKSSTKNTDNTTGQKIQKAKEKSFSLYSGGGGGAGRVEKTKYTDEYGNKHKRKESMKLYRNPLNDEQVTVKKTKMDGKRTKEVTRERDYDWKDKLPESLREPMKEAVARSAGEAGPMAADRTKGMIGTPAAAPQEAPKVKLEELTNRIKESKGNAQQYKEAIERIKKTPKYETR